MVELVFHASSIIRALNEMARTRKENSDGCTHVLGLISMHQIFVNFAGQRIHVVAEPPMRGEVLLLWSGRRNSCRLNIHKLRLWWARGPPGVIEGRVRRVAQGHVLPLSDHVTALSRSLKAPPPPATGRKHKARSEAAVMPLAMG